MNNIIERHIALLGGSDKDNKKLREQVQQASTVSIMQAIRIEMEDKNIEAYNNVVQTGDSKQIREFIEQAVPNLEELFHREVRNTIAAFRTNPAIA